MLQKKRKVRNVLFCFWFVLFSYKYGMAVLAGVTRLSSATAEKILKSRLSLSSSARIEATLPHR
jgi:hypothetical protein